MKMKMIAVVLTSATCVSTFGCGDWANGRVATPPPTSGQENSGAKPQVIFREDFERAAIGSKPKSTTVHPPEAGAIVVAIRDNAPDDARCLRIQDSAEFKMDYWPFFYYSPTVSNGLATLAFDIRIDGKTSLHHQWRDRENPFKTGPQLRIEAGTLNVGTQTLMTLPVDTWVRIEIAAGVGAASTGTWRLTVTTPDRGARTFKDLPFTNKAWNHLGLLGFISTAKTRTTCCLDNLLLTVIDAPKP